jgi:hypothetical protein
MLLSAGPGSMTPSTPRPQRSASRLWIVAHLAAHARPLLGADALIDAG